MKIYTVQELQSEGVQPELVKTRSRINCFSKTFIRDRDLPKRFTDEAMKTLNEHLAKGTNGFIVETPLFLTVWTEEKKQEEIETFQEQTAPALPKKLVPFPAEQPTIAGSSPEPDLPLATVRPSRVSRRIIVRKYRGNEYTIEV
jgi:hypothetical protein